MIVINRVG